MFTKTIYTPLLFFIKSQVSSTFLADFRVDGNFIVFSKNLILFFVQRIFYTKFNENILIRSTIVFLNYLFLSWLFFFYIFKISEICQQEQVSTTLDNARQNSFYVWTKATVAREFVR